MDKKKKNIIAVIIIAVIFLLYISVYIGLLYYTVPFPTNLLIGLVPTVLAIAFIKVFLDRIREINEGKDDDLDKY